MTAPFPFSTVRTVITLGIGACAVALTARPAAAQQGAPAALPAATPLVLVAAAAADTSGDFQFDIPAQPLADALRAYAQVTGLRVQMEASLMTEVRSSAVVGTYNAAEGLRRLLAGSGFVARFADAGTVVVSRSRSASAQVLDRVVVKSAAAARASYVPRTSTTATKTNTPLRDTPQAVTVVTQQLIADQSMQGMADVVRYTPGVTMGQGEGHRDAPTLRGNASTADFFVDGVRDDAQYFRDLYNAERVETLKGSNAMIFGRGGGGGVINRVSKEAQWVPVHALTLEGGSWEHRRATADIGQGTGPLAGRLTAMFEDSKSYRDYAGLRRWGVNPTGALAVGQRTMLRAGYEYFRDDRTVDRGIPSYAGLPSHAAREAFFGSPSLNTGEVTVQSAGLTLDHVFASGITFRNRTRYGAYDKFYQNVYPTGVLGNETEATLSAYSNVHDRANLFNQTDVTIGAQTGAVRHTLLFGAEVGRQETDNRRLTGYFNGSTTNASDTVAFATPTAMGPVGFYAKASDANNDVRATVAAVYAQNQVELSTHWQAIVGLRYDRFALRFHDRRASATARELTRDDEMVSPRAGLVFKPAEPVSFYTNYSVSYLPSSGDQFSSLTATTKTLKPEQFTNYEVGAKWDVRPDVALTTAVYRLDRTNTAYTDPNNAAVTLQTGAQRTTGVELGVMGNVADWWQIAGGYANQKAEIVSATSSGKKGATVPLVPRQTASLWNKVRVHPRASLALGVVHQADMFAAIDDKVTLPGFTRLDGAAYLNLTSSLRAQLNVENLLDETYYPTSHGNNNIMPGAPRTFRLTFSAGR